jgi:hypothetical protein
LEIPRAEPELEEPITEGVKALVSFGISEIGKAGEDPVKPLPLVVDLPAGARPTELIAPRKKCADPGRAADLFAK